MNAEVFQSSITQLQHRTIQVSFTKFYVNKKMFVVYTQRAKQATSNL